MKSKGKEVRANSERMKFTDMFKSVAFWIIFMGIFIWNLVSQKIDYGVIVFAEVIGFAISSFVITFIFSAISWLIWGRKV